MTLFKRKTFNGVMHTWAGPLHWWSGIDSTTGEHHWGWEWTTR